MSSSKIPSAAAAASDASDAGEGAVLVIPEDLTFAMLELARDRRTGDLSFNWEPIERICAASDLDLDTLLAESGENLSELILAWYEAHLAAGGPPDPVQESLLQEVEAEARQEAPPRRQR